MSLARADLSEDSKRAYASRVRGYLDWLATGPDLAAEVDPLADPAGRDFAIRDYRAWLKTVRKAKPATINAHLTALDHFYSEHLHLGRPAARRERISDTAPEALTEPEQRRFLRGATTRGAVVSVAGHSPLQRAQAIGRGAGIGPARDQAIALLLLYTGVRVEEAASLDLDDVALSARRGTVTVRAGKGRDGGALRQIPLHHAARDALRAWITARHITARLAGWDSPALFVNRGGQRLSTRSLHAIIAEISLAAGLVHDAGPDAGKSRVHPHTLRHTFATQLLRNGADVVLVADRAMLETCG